MYYAFLIEVRLYTIIYVFFMSYSEVGMYETRFRNPDGFTLCQILARNHEVRPIQVIGSTNQVLTFFSPGLVDSPPVKYVQYRYRGLQ